MDMAFIDGTVHYLQNKRSVKEHFVSKIDGVAVIVEGFNGQIEIISANGFKIFDIYTFKKIFV